MAKRPKRLTFLSWGIGLVVVASATALLWGPSLTIRGVPVPIILTFLQDEQAREAYFSDNKQGLHNRLQELNIETEIKAFYRPQIPDEIQLDQHIHQIFYDTTGYVGKAYRVSADGILVLIDHQYEQWYSLAHRAGVVVDSQYANGTHYVVSPEGIVAPYQQVAKSFPIPMLKQLIKLKSEQVPPGGNAL
ncbi:hypothetical protein [Acaryochloris sp. IP29b_bin.137]|uniref:hypothetical protein n=1 Tax=Acaryochloris sp. IP29b_bin.137 TaxID=2969217 RepID=UPI002625A1F8|nr:hypothetical protein [Acaryochloris sp. IP29b_bin.137]